MASVTQRDIAQATGVHVSTVSRVLAQARRGLPPSGPTAAKILKYAQRTGYERDIVALGLRTRQSRMLGVLVPRLTDITLSTIYEGLEQEASERGYQAVVANTLDDPAEQRRRGELLLQRRVDGLILGDHRQGDTYTEELSKRGVPCVLMNRWCAGVDSVTCDDLGGGRVIARHLTTSMERTRGCVEALEEEGLPVRPGWVVPSDFAPAEGRRAALALMSRKDRPTAIFAATDTIAIGVMSALRDLQLVPGRDVAVAGFNDIALAKELLVPLTTMRNPMRQMGAVAADLLIQKLSNPSGGTEPTALKLPAELVVRESTIGRGSDPDSPTASV